MPQVGFETTISVGERPQTYALDRAANGIGAGTVWGPVKLLTLKRGSYARKGSDCDLSYDTVQTFGCD